MLIRFLKLKFVFILYFKELLRSVVCVRRHWVQFLDWALNKNSIVHLLSIGLGAQDTPALPLLRNTNDFYFLV